MAKEKPISIMIHDLNPWGGQDRSMLEIAWQLNKSFPLEIHSYSLEGYDNWRDMTHIKYETLIKRPVIFKYFHYQWSTWFKLQQQKRSGTTPIIQSTGTASLKSNIVQVQFIHHSWEKIKQTLPKDKSSSLNPFRRIYHNWLTQYKQDMEAKSYTRDKKFIAISHGIKKELMEHFQIPQKNITIIHHGVDTEHFKPANDEQDKENKKLRSELGYADDDIVLLHVGALNARKGIFKTFKILSYLKKNGFENVKFLAVGDGDHKIFNRAIKEYDIADRVQILSHSKDIRSFYSMADVFFFPTYYEPFGLVILEAMACGLPVATTNCSGAAELINDGENGILFSTEESEQVISDKLNSLVKQPKVRKLMGEKARETSLLHSWDSVGKEYIQFYQDNVYGN